MSRSRIKVSQYADYWRNGFLVVPGLVPEYEALRRYADDLLHGRIDVPGMPPPPEKADMETLHSRFTRIHMLHRASAEAERAMLHSRVLDVLEALMGPDVLALQTMLFLNPPGRGGQGWHQDAYYIPTLPQTLIGAWIALDDADEENGCLWVAPGSHAEPIYPPNETGGPLHNQEAFDDLAVAENVSSLNDQANSLTAVSEKHGAVSVPVEAGSVVFFHGHLLHRSYPNRSANRYRRAFVSHFCNARSWVPWNHGRPYEGASANYCHILARGRTHLPFAEPLFGTPCAALEPEASEAPPVDERMMGVGGEMVSIGADYPQED